MTQDSLWSAMMSFILKNRILTDLISTKMMIRNFQITFHSIEKFLRMHGPADSWDHGIIPTPGNEAHGAGNRSSLEGTHNACQDAIPRYHPHCLSEPPSTLLRASSVTTDCGLTSAV